MPAGLPVAIALLALAASGTPAVPAPPPVAAASAVKPANPPPATTASNAKPVYGPVLPAARKPAVKSAVTDTCAQIRADAPSREIVVCAQQGYRLNPDVLEAKREARNGGAPRRPENYK
jgi:hypothetical protein